MTQMFYPEPGDIIVCKNGYEYTCVAKKDYPYIGTYPDYSVFGIRLPNRADHMCWKSHDGKAEHFSDFDIAEIVKAIKEGV